MLRNTKQAADNLKDAVKGIFTGVHTDVGLIVKATVDYLKELAALARQRISQTAPAKAYATATKDVNPELLKGAQRLGGVLLVVFCVAAIISSADESERYRLEFASAAHQEQYIDSLLAADMATPKAESSLDFTALKAENPDIYAWIYIPNTQVNYPILQHPTDDTYYLTHNKEGEIAVEGAIYTELENSKDFDDPVTVIYGHNINSGAMFQSVHDFENASFFKDNPTFYIYTPGHVRTYMVAASVVLDDAHLLYGHDYYDKVQYASYLDFIQYQASERGNLRGNLGLGLDSRIVQLSTCTNGAEDERYVLTGMLIDDRQLA